ncbi:MAG: acylphosphatase [Cyanophyceae cyanobacterium]
MQESSSVEVLISGRVQGVGYRAATVEQASSLGVNGWVTNLSSGQVKAVFEGPKPAVEQMIAWCHTGPPAAAVEAIAVNASAWQDIQGFEIRS